MDELTAAEKGYARKNENNHEWREGYHVQYKNPDGTTYDSWSPKRVFEVAYKCADNFKDRLIIEQGELHDRIEKLTNFVKTDNFKYLKLEKRKILISQLKVMQEYEIILLQRMSSI